MALYGSQQNEVPCWSVSISDYLHESTARMAFLAATCVVSISDPDDRHDGGRWNHRVGAECRTGVYSA
jgi:hypothetical protein